MEANSPDKESQNTPSERLYQRKQSCQTAAGGNLEWAILWGDFLQLSLDLSW